MITNEERLLRLKHLAREVLPFVEPELFNMASWARKGECGTVCCAAGSDALTPFAQERGLKLALGRFTGDSFDIFYAGYFSLSAVSRYYGLTDNETDYCFLGVGYLRRYRLSIGHSGGDGWVIDLHEVPTVNDISPARVAAHVENIIAFYEA